MAVVPPRTMKWLATAVLALAFLALPAAAGADPIGSQFQISFMGSSETESRADRPAVAHNPTNDQYLTVWEGMDVFGDWEIWGRFVSGDGTPLGDKFQISNLDGVMPPNETSTGCVFNALAACDPDVAYNSRANEFMVVWEGHTAELNGQVGPRTAQVQDVEIFAQRLDAAGNQLSTNGETGATDSRISNITGTRNAGAFDPKIAYNAVDDQYLVVFTGTLDAKLTGALNQRNIYGQRLDAAGNELNTGPSNAPTDATMTTGVLANNCSIFNNDFGQCEPDVAHDSRNNRWFVVWLEQRPGDDNENEVYGRHFDADGTATNGDPEFLVSDMGLDPGDDTTSAQQPAVVFNPVTGEFFVVWHGFIPDESQIFGTRVPPFGSPFTPGQFQISQMPGAGGPGEEGLRAEFPAVAADTRAGEYLVVWSGNAGEGLQLEEVYGQKLTSAGGEIGTNDVRISTHDPGPEFFRGTNAAVAYDPNRCEYLPVWTGEIPKGEGRTSEIFGRRHAAAPLCGTPAGTPPPPAAAPQGTTAPKPGRPSVRVAGVRRACVSRSTRITFRITPQSGATLRSVRVTLDGRRIASTRRTRFSVTVNVRRLKEGRHRLVVVATDSAGNRTTVRRTIARCAQARPRREAAPRFTG